MPSRNESRGENRQRLMEIMEVVRRHDITRGMSPEKLCAIIEELGPTFIKLGQILSMRSDFLPKEYCDALKKLRSDVSPMSYAQVVAIVEASYGRPSARSFPPLTSRRWAARPSRRCTPPCCKAASPWWSRCSARAFTT